MSVENTSFLINVDLEIYSEHGLTELFQVMKSDVVLINIDEAQLDENCNFICLEVLSQPQSIDEAFSLFGTIVAKLDGRARAIWSGCSSRVLNIGIQSVRHCHQEEFKVSMEALATAQSMDASIAITVYAPVESHAV